MECDLAREYEPGLMPAEGRESRNARLTHIITIDIITNPIESIDIGSDEVNAATCRRECRAKIA